MRSWAIEKGLFDKNSKLHHAATDYGEDFDREVDFGMREKLEKEEGRIFDAWLSGFMGQQVDGVLKVLVKCSDDAVRVDRIINRDVVSVGEAKNHIFEREEKNKIKWQKMYKDEWTKWVVDKGLAKSEEEIDFWREELYDLVIDTYSHSKDETLNLVQKALGND